MATAGSYTTVSEVSSACAALEASKGGSKKGGGKKGKDK